LVTLGITATATGRTGFAEATGIRSQLRRLLSSVPRARMAFERDLDGAILAIRIGLVVLPTIPLTRCRRPLVTTGGLPLAATGLMFGFMICI
jgi:hypothetical protein